MRLNVTVPVSESDGDWQRLIFNIVIAGVEVLIVAVVVTLLYTKRITKPIIQLKEAAEQVDSGNYDLKLDYEKDDEIGILTKTFKKLAGHMKDHINDLSKQVFVDALTRVKNKGAFSQAVEELQEQIDKGGEAVRFAVCVFDCDNLKMINDRFGHDKGDIYLKTASDALCGAFRHSQVYRIGGDEFSIILRGEDYHNMDYLTDRFLQDVDTINASAVNPWDQVQIAMGVSSFDQHGDRSVNDVIRRADNNMYENKRKRKKLQAESRN